MFGFGQQKNPQAMQAPMGGLGGFMGDNSGMLMNAGMALLAHRQNSNQTPLTDVAQMATLGSAMDTKRGEKREAQQSKNMTVEWLVKNGYAKDYDEGQMLVDTNAVKDIFAEKFKPKEPEWKVVDGKLVKIAPGADPEWMAAPEGMGGSTEYGLSPVYGEDAQGNPALGQLAKDGTFRQTPLPDGFQLTPGVDRIDLGTAWGITNRAGDIVSTIPKDIEGAAAAEVRGKQTGEYQAGLPEALAKGEQMLQTIESVRGAPGREMGTGRSRFLDPRSYGPGSQVADFDAKLAQLQGQTFLQAYESLKGGGVITEVEGQKAENAIARLQTSQSDGEFLAALNELEAVVKGAMERAQMKAGGTQGGAGQPTVRRYNQQTGRIE